MLGDTVSASTWENWHSDLTSAVHASLSKCWSLSWLALFLLVAKHYFCIPFWASCVHHSAVLERFCTLFSVYNVSLKCKMFFIWKSNLWRANTVFQSYRSGILVPDHHRILFGFIFVFRKLDCMFVLMSDCVFPFLFFSRTCVCSFKIFSFRWNAIFFSICKYDFIVVSYTLCSYSVITWSNRKTLRCEVPENQLF